MVDISLVYILIDVTALQHGGCLRKNPEKGDGAISRSPPSFGVGTVPSSSIASEG